MRPLEQTKLDWLKALTLIESFDAVAGQNQQAAAAKAAGEPFEDTPSFFKNPGDTMRALVAEHNKPKAKAPKPLAKHDIPVQYIIMAAGLVAGLWILLIVVRVRGVSYRYEPSTMTLELSNGRKVTPAMIADVDKRLWHKFFVTLHFIDGSKTAKLDLYVHVPLEEWVLEMEPHTPNYVPEEDEDDEPDSDEEAIESEDESAEHDEKA